MYLKKKYWSREVSEDMEKYLEFSEANPASSYSNYLKEIDGGFVKRRERRNQTISFLVLWELHRKDGEDFIWYEQV